MAIWQFCCYIIPNKNVGISINSEEILSWANISLPNNFNEEANTILKKTKGWSSKIIVYGDISETCLKILCDNEKIEEISLRLDLRTLKKDELESILELINKIKGKILYNGKVYDVTLSTILELIKNSDAAKYCKDPIRFLDEL